LSSRYHSTQFAIVLFTWLQNLTLRFTKKIINFRLCPQTPAGASSLDPLETSVLETP